MAEKNPPALTPAEWRSGIVDRPPYAITLRDGVLQVHGVGTTITIPPELRKPLAAFCLDGIPGGFDWEDVDEAAMAAQDADAKTTAALKSIADRLAAIIRDSSS